MGRMVFPNGVVKEGVFEMNVYKGPPAEGVTQQRTQGNAVLPKSMYKQRSSPKNSVSMNNSLYERKDSPTSNNSRGIQN